MKKTFLLVIPLMLITLPAYAYLDSGTGSMIIQMLFAAVAGAIAMLKFYWQKVKRSLKMLWSKLTEKKSDHDKKG